MTKIKFYSILKNEDATPYIGDNLLIVADGLGGSGSAVHQIDRSRHRDLHSEIMSGVFGDISHASDEIEQFIHSSIAPLSDSKDDTSALWASRIVSTRCAYALTDGEFKEAKLDDKKVRADLAEFISKGLHNAVETFDLKNGKYDNQRLLPTTLAFIRYAEQENSVIAETVWAGDSRCYALTPEGLKLLSVDDEDESGTITNLFYTDNPKIHLNYLRHEIQKPCVLMAVSDGIFDPFNPHDHLGVEHTLLSAISECASEEKLADRLHSLFNSIHGDDATMAFVPFGFADFADMKKTLKERAEKIQSIMQKKDEMHSALEVINLSEEEAKHYVTSRTSDRYDHIISTVLDAIERGTDDVAITAEVRSTVEELQKASRAASEKAERERRERALDELSKHALSHPEDLFPQTATTTISSFSETSQKRLFTELKQAAGEYVRQRNRFDELKSKEENWAKGKEELHQRIKERIDIYQKDYDVLWPGQDYQSLAQRKEATQNLTGWYFIDNTLKAGVKLQEKDIKDKLPSKERKSASELVSEVRRYLDDFKDWQNKQEAQKKTGNTLKGNYTQAWNKFLNEFRSDERLINGLFSRETIDKFGLAEPDDTFDSAIAKGGKDKLLKELKAKKETIISGIVEAMAIGYNKTSILDDQYNATKLNLFRTYYKLQSDSKSGVKELEKELLALEAQYTSLVDHAKF